MKKKGITDSVNFARIRIDSYNYLPTEKILTFNNVIMLIKSVVNKNKNGYYHNIFLEKGLDENKYNTYFLKINVCIYYKCCLMLIKQAIQKSAIFSTIGII